MRRIPGLEKKRPQLTVLEESGDFQALAATFSNFKSEKEIRLVHSPRASSVYEDCMRKLVIGVSLKLKEPKWQGIRDRLTFGIGNAVHDWLQNSPSIFGDRRYGWWKCLACGQVRYFGSPPKKDCSCGARPEASIYHEHSFEITHPVTVSGHPDMFFKPSWAKKLRITELKTLAGDEFDKLPSPFIGHEWQTHVYMWGCQNDPSLPVQVDEEVSYIVYVTKRNRPGDFPMKVFPVVRNELIIKRIKEKLMQYQTGMKSFPKNLPPPAEECVRGSYSNYKAKWCVSREECMSHAR